MLPVASILALVLGQGSPMPSAGPGTDLLRAAHTDVDPAAGSYGRACLERTDALPLEGGATLVLVAATDTEGVCAPGMKGTHRWELEVIRGDATRARSVAHARVGRSTQDGAPTARLRRLAERPLAFQVEWGTAGAGEGVSSRRELWTLDGDRPLRWLGLGVAAGAPDSATEVELTEGKADGEAVVIEGRRVVRGAAAEGEAGEPRWSASLPGAYRIEGGARTILRAIPRAVTASSELPPTAADDRGGRAAGDHRAARAADDRRDTAWCEGAPGAGGGQWIELDLDDPLPLTAVTILPGDAASPERFAASARPRRVRVIAPPRASVEVELADRPEAQRITLGPGGDVRTIQVRVISVWRGTRNADLCVSDLFADGRR